SAAGADSVPSAWRSTRRGHQSAPNRRPARTLAPSPHRRHAARWANTRSQRPAPPSKCCPIQTTEPPTGLNHYRSKCQPMTTEVTISLAQIDCRIADPETNFARAATLVAEAARRGSDLVILPELWSTAYALDQAAA